MLTLQNVSSEDQSFLFEVYAQTRAEELQAMGWSCEERESFLRMQFDMQQRSYAMQYPAAEHQTVLLDQVRIGRMITDVTEEALLLIDISLLPEHQKQGIGTRLIRDLQQKAAETGKKVRLHVLNHNPAHNLYTRLDFRITGEKFPYLAMEWQPSNKITHSRGVRR